MEYTWGTIWGRGIWGMPEIIAVTCPRCMVEAIFEPPFEFLPSDTPLKGLHRWNDVLVRER
jgi:hypothetical protein